MRPYPVNLASLLRLPAALALALAHGVVAAAGYYGSGWYREAGLQQSYDDNVSRSGAPADIASDFITRVDAAFRHTRMMGSAGRLSLAGRVAYERFDGHGDLSNVEADMEGYYVYQPNPGFSAPWYELSARLSRIEPRDSRIRRSTVADAGASAGKRLTDTLTARLGYRYSERWAQSEVFDTRDHALQLDLDMSLSPGMGAWLAYEFHAGAVVSTATPAAWIFAAAEAWEPDEAYGRVSGPGCSPRCAYRLDGRTHVVGAGFEFELTNHASVDLSGTWFHTDWEGGGAYHGLTLGVALYLNY